ncbi:MAG TPA: GNAT family N-acetyltransferase [Chthoniobacteraceae bacterium]|jgi:hypothetical protein|nr:GNAT family N-acetyltransferase [Chthoniobacteraceae bacterium]
MLQAVQIPSSHEIIQTSVGPVEVYSWCRDVDPVLWEACFGAQLRDPRFYHLAEDCLMDQFSFRYLVLRNAATGAASLQPALVVDQDGAAGLPRQARRLVAAFRRLAPRFLQMRLLMVGCSAGEGHMGSTEPWALKALHEALPQVAKSAGASVIVLKDFPAEYRGTVGPVFKRDYRRVPGMPAATLDLNYASFEDYLQRRVGKVFRKNLRRKFRKLENAPPLIMEVIADASHLSAELFALYRQTFERSEFQFEVLNPEYFERLGRDMPDKTRFFIWRQNARMVAFNVCLVHDGVIYDLDLGMDYSVALDLHMYFVTWRDIVEWSIRNGLRTYHTGPLNYDPKLHLKLKLAPQDLYARHVRGWLNPFFKVAMQFMHPVRHNPILAQFENAGEL